jgi:ABC-type sugar transport system permease subunit
MVASLTAKRFQKKKGFTFSKDLLFYVAILAFPLVQFIIFYLVVNFNSIFLAFKKYTFVTGQGYIQTWCGFDNFTRVWDELANASILRDALRNSLFVWLFTTFVGTFLAAIFSFYISNHRFLGKFFKFALFLPSVLPTILLTSMFTFFANTAIPGYLGNWFHQSIQPLLMDAHTRFWCILFYSVWIGFGGQVLLYSGALGQMNPTIVEAAELDGASSGRIFLHIALPHLMPTIGTFLISGVAGLFVSQANLYNFFGMNAEYSDSTIGYYLFRLVNGSVNSYADYPYAAALGLCCTCLAIPLTMIVRKIVKRWE